MRLYHSNRMLPTFKFYLKFIKLREIEEEYEYRNLFLYKRNIWKIHKVYVSYHVCYSNATYSLLFYVISPETTGVFNNGLESFIHK